MPHELKGREIFAVGEWNGIEFTDTDLDDIVANFDKLKDQHRVPLKFGHDSDKHVPDGQPAIGWISRIFKQGEKLFADFSDMPRTVFEAIKNKLYRTVSIELLFNVDSDGNRFNHVLDAVALLGADHPAVSSLADLDALLATRTRFSGGHRVAFRTIAGTSKKLKKEDEPMPLEKKDVENLINEAMEPVVAENVQLKKDLDAEKVKTAKFASDKADDEKKALEEKVKLSRKAVADVLDAAVRSKSLTPAFREVYEKQIGLADDERVLEIDVEEVKKLFSIKDDDAGKPIGLHKSDDENTDDPEEKLMSLVNKSRAETGKTFNEAFTLVAAANPELHRAYLDANGEV